jgi:hypothetical protein
MKLKGRQLTLFTRETQDDPESLEDEIAWLAAQQESDEEDEITMESITDELTDDFDAIQTRRAKFK